MESFDWKSNLNRLNFPIDGGLGSQMTKVAVGKIVEKMLNCRVFFDISFYEKQKSHHNGFELLQVFPNVSINTYRRKTFCEKICRMLPETNSISAKFAIKQTLDLFARCLDKTKEKVITETYENKLTPAILRSNLSICRPVYYNSHWFNFAEFAESHESFLQNLFQFDESNISQKTSTLIESIVASSQPYISVHIRRGDYFSLPSNASFWEDIFADGYYERAINHITSMVKHPNWVFFTDEIEWLSSNMALPSNSVIVDWNRSKDSWQDMLIISKCHHNIIANSSFSMWGSILNKHEKKIVVCPKKWIKNRKLDHLPFNSWVRL